MNGTRYQSPMTNRYGSVVPEIWSNDYKLYLQTQIWLSHYNWLAKLKEVPEVEHYFGTKDASFESYSTWAAMFGYDLAIQDLEAQTEHELVAELGAFRKLNEQLIKFSPHAGLTSSNIQDQTMIMQVNKSSRILWKKWRAIHTMWQSSTHAMLGFYDFTMGRTHYQPAEKMLLAHRVAFALQSLDRQLFRFHDAHHDLIRFFRTMAGSVGNYGNLAALCFAYGVETNRQPWFSSGIINQTVDRQLELGLLNSMSQVAALFHKVAHDYRISCALSPVIKHEGKVTRIGSSAMPYKHNPILAEKICSLARRMLAITYEAWMNSALAGFERTLDDSANRRSYLPEAFILSEEIAQSVIELGPDLFPAEAIDLDQTNVARRHALEQAGVTDFTQLLVETPNGDPTLLAEIVSIGEFLNTVIDREWYFPELKIGHRYELWEWE